MNDFAGKPDALGRALVLLHGAGGRHSLWDEVLGLLEREGIPAIALDLPGHGGSPLPRLQSVAALAEAVAARLGEIQVKRAVMAGHSLGGAVALTMACSRAVEVYGVGVVSSGASLPVSEALLSGIVEDFPATAAKISRAAFHKNAPAGASASMEWMTLQGGSEQLYADFTACAGYGLTSGQLEGVLCPVSIVCGDGDRFTPLSLSEELSAALPEAVLAVLPGVGHMAMIEAPAQTCAALAALWRRAHPA